MKAELETRTILLEDPILDFQQKISQLIEDAREAQVPVDYLLTAKSLAAGILVSLDKFEDLVHVPGSHVGVVK